MRLHKIIIPVAVGVVLTACNDDTPAPTTGACPIQFDVTMPDDGNARSSRYQPGATIITGDDLTEKSPSLHVMGIFSYHLLHAFDKWLNYDDRDWHFYDNPEDSGKELRKQLYWTTDPTNDKSWSYETWNLPSFFHLDFYAVGGTVGTGDPTLHYKENFYTDKYVNGEYHGGTAYLNYVNPEGHNWVNDVLWGAVDTHSTPTNDVESVARNERVHLEMKHAMSKIMFTFQNSNQYTYIEVENIRLNNVYRNGRLMFEKDFNLNIYIWWDANQYGNKGQIYYGNGYQHMKTMSFNGVTSQASMLDNDNNPFYYLALPQKIGHWGGGQVGTDVPSVSFYMQIHNKNGADNNKTDESNGNSNPIPAHWQWITIPLSNAGQAVEWKPGMAYTYHVVFGDVDGWLADGTPAIVRVSCSGIEVEDFTHGGTYTPEMK